MEKIVIQNIDEIIYHDTCDNGLDVYMWVNDKVKNFYMTYNCKYGSIHTEFKLKGGKKFIKVPNGVAHFLEHVNFNEPDGTTAHEYFNKLGSSINAFTTFEYTAYEVMASSNFKENLTHLLDYVGTPYFTKDLVSKEKNIIIEEVKMGENSPGQLLYYGANQSLFHNDKRKELITGEVDDVKNISEKDLQLVYDTFYHPKNMFVVITGNFNPEEAITIIKENQASREITEYKNPVIKPVKEPVEVATEYKEIPANVEIPKVKISFKIKKSVFKSLEDREIRLLLSYVLRANFGSTSDFKEELMENELVTYLSYNYAIVGDGDLVTLSIIAETEYPKEIVKKILEKLNNLDFDEVILKRRKRANIASLIDDFDDIEYVNSSIQNDIIKYNKIIDNVYDLYSKITLKQVEDFIKKIDINNYTVNVLVPNNK